MGFFVTRLQNTSFRPFSINIFIIFLKGKNTWP